MRKTLNEDERRDLAQRVYQVLNDFVGTLHACRFIMIGGIKQAENPQMRHAARYALQIAFGAIALTIRKFEDLWSKHIPDLIPERSERPPQGSWVIAESKQRRLRESADQLIAHYGKRGEWPLSPEKIEALIRSNGWETEEEVVIWVGPVIGKLMEMRDDLGQRYGITSGKAEEGGQ